MTDKLRATYFAIAAAAVVILAISVTTILTQADVKRACIEAGKNVEWAAFPEWWRRSVMVCISPTTEGD